MKVARSTRTAQIRALRSLGLTTREIAGRLGISVNTIYTYNADPTGDLDRIRKRDYGRDCQRCGRRTTGSNGHERAPKLCADCWHLQSRYWTPELIVERIQDWYSRYDQPPTAHDWNPNLAIRMGRPDRAERFREGYWPYTAVVQRRFGSWNNAIRAAGFRPLRAGSKYVDREEKRHYAE